MVWWWMDVLVLDFPQAGKGWVSDLYYLVAVAKDQEGGSSNCFHGVWDRGSGQKMLCQIGFHDHIDSTGV